MQPSAQIVITGLGVEDCGAYIAACNGAGKRWTYSAADELLAAPALGSDGPLVFWLYRAPWQLPPGGPMADEWLALHRRLLRGRAAFGGRLVLINADAEQPSDVLASLGLAGDGVASSVSGPAIDAGMSALLAKVFDWAAPEFWDVFEALESAAPPTGRTPLFRSALQAPGADQVLTMQRLVAAGAQAPSLASDLQSTQQQLSASQQLAEQGRTQALELERENELLLLQLHQVQEELEQYFLDNRQLQQVMGQSRHSLDRARHLISRLMLASASRPQATVLSNAGSVTSWSNPAAARRWNKAWSSALTARPSLPWSTSTNSACGW